MIALIQLIGPVAILVWSIWALDWSEVEVRTPFDYEYGSQTHGVSCITTRLMCCMFLFLFTLFGLATLKKDDETLLKLRLMNLSMREPGTPEIGWFTLNCVGPFINAWVVVLTSIDMLL